MKIFSLIVIKKHREEKRKRKIFDLNEECHLRSHTLREFQVMEDNKTKHFIGVLLIRKF